MGTERVGVSRRFVRVVVERLCNICIMFECGIVMVFLPCLCGPHETAREAWRVVGSFIE